MLTKRSLTVGSLKNGGHSSLPKMAGQNTPSSRPENHGRSQDQATIKLIQNQTTYQVIPQKGITLLNAALAQNQPLDYKCTKGTCGRCTVKLAAGGAFLSNLNEKEQEKLKGLAKEGYRLACQAVFK